MSTYASRYIHQLLNSDVANSPDMSRVGEYRDVVDSVWESWRRGKSSAAREAWQTIIRLRPELLAFPQPRNLIKADELKFLTAPEYLLSEYPFYASSFNVIVGASGGGKSFVALDFCGKLILADKNHVIVYIAGEGLNGYASRWECLKDHLGLEHGTDRFRFYQKPVQIMDAESRQAFIDEVNEEGIRPTMIVVDTLARSAVGMEENSNKEMGQFVAGLDALRAIWDCGVLVVHHTGKDGHIRGASALLAACDSALMLTKADGVIKLSNSFDDGGKNKHAKELDAQYVELVPYDVGGDFPSAVIRRAQAIVRTPTVTGELTATQRSLLELLDSADTGVRVNSMVEYSGKSQPTVYRVIKELKQSNYITHDKTTDTYTITDTGKKAFYAG